MYPLCYAKSNCTANRKVIIPMKKAALLIYLVINAFGFPTTLLSQYPVLQSDTARQKDLIDFFIKELHIHGKKMPVRGTKKVYYSFLPFATKVPGGGNALVSSTTAGFYIGSRKSTSLSSATFYPYLTFVGRFGYSLQTSLWLKDNKWNVAGDTRFLYYPQYTWGLGGRIPETHRVLVQYSYIRFYQTFLRKIKPYLMTGLGYHIDEHHNIQTPEDTLGLTSFTGYTIGTQKGSSSLSTGLSFNVLYDGRINSFNPMPGYYANIVYRFSPQFLGSNTNQSSLYVDVRRYLLYSRVEQNMLAFWAFWWTGLNRNTPYLDLPSIGWDPYQQRSGRGFDQNRYRGKGLLYAETEYRKDITQNGMFGYVVFANLNSVTENNSNRYAYIHLAAGAGLRIKFNKSSSTNIGIDVGFSKSYTGLYINLGETF